MPVSWKDVVSYVVGIALIAIGAVFALAFLFGGSLCILAGLLALPVVRHQIHETHGIE